MKKTSGFMEKLNELASGKKFSWQGECTGFAMQQLRAWEFLEYEEFNNQKPRNTIIEERQENFKKKVAILKKYNIENDFE